jgi:ribonuclease HI
MAAASSPSIPVEKVYFSVPFHEKELAKRNGAKWDPKMKSWWFPKSDLTDFIRGKWTVSVDTTNQRKRKHVVHSVSSPEIFEGMATDPSPSSAKETTSGDKTIAEYREAFEGEKILRGWFDGGSRGNPGICGYGAVLRAGNGRKLGVRMGAKRKGTNNDAEYMGIISLLEMIEERLCDSVGTSTGTGAIVVAGLTLTDDEKSKNVSADYTVRIEIYGDSNLVIQQVSGEWKTKQESTREYCRRAQEILDRIRKNSNVVSVSLEQIDRDNNAEADEYSNIAMDTITS